MAETKKTTSKTKASKPQAKKSTSQKKPSAKASAQSRKAKEMEMDLNASGAVLDEISKKLKALKEENENLKKELEAVKNSKAEEAKAEVENAKAAEAEAEAENADTAETSEEEAKDSAESKLQEALDQAKDKYQRLMAEFENMRKRTEKESSRQYDIGAKDVLEKLLPVVDNFERAMAMVTDEQREDAFVQGVERIYKQMNDYLVSVKVTPMDAAGKEFNADFHNAVMHEDNDEYGENIVMEELQKGYMYKEEVLRHSMVKVAN